MEGLLWFLQNSAGFDAVRMFVKPLAILFVLYYSAHVAVFVKLVLERLGILRDPLDGPPRPMPDALLVLPTLLSHRGSLEALQQGIRSVVSNGYPGRLTVCAAIDDADRVQPLVAELEEWVSRLPLPAEVDAHVVRCPKRAGKAMAMDRAIELVKRQVERGERASFPPVFFNLDADSELSPRALERMAYRLTTPRGLFREPPKIVTSNVQVRRSHYWKGWRHFFTVKGQLSLGVAREFTNSIGLGRHSARIMPVTSVSGALYCTWSEIHLQAPRYGRFVRSIRLWDWVKWWCGAPPPPFAAGRHQPLPESAIGPGDDTWIAWIAMSARWKDGRIDLELPATPLHALLETIKAWLARPLAYDPKAAVSTSSPTTIRGLFKQRVRWNSSRIWLIHRRGFSMLFSWSVALPVFADLALLFSVNAAFVLGLLLFPVTRQPATWFALLVVFNLFYVALRTGATLLAMAQDGGIRERWPLLLALPTSGLFHTVFNIMTTVTGFTRELLLFGVNTHFAPEETLMRSGTGRVALAYRIKRALTLAVRALVKGDVPFGWFWFGWEETPWTSNGYRGWTTPVKAGPKTESPPPQKRPELVVQRAEPALSRSSVASSHLEQQ